MTEVFLIMLLQDPNKKVACRYDWHQTPGFVTMSIYSKVCLPNKTWVEVNQVFAKVHVTFDKGNSVFHKEFPLRGVSTRHKESLTVVAVLDLGFDQGGGIPHQAEKGGGIWQLGGGMF